MEVPERNELTLPVSNKRGEISYSERADGRKSIRSAYLLDLIDCLQNTATVDLDFSYSFLMNYELFTNSSMVLDSIIKIMEKSMEEDSDKRTVLR